MKTPQAFLLSVGDEVLSGRVVNTNQSFLSEELTALGIATHRANVVGDDREAIHEACRSFLASTEQVMITTGGLGPTHDDFTKEAICEALGKTLVPRAEAEAVLRRYFPQGYEECNRKQTLFPADALLLENKVGTADGCILEIGEKSLIILVGPPHEMHPMFREGVVPYLKKKTHDVFLTHDFILMGGTESGFEPRVMAVKKAFPHTVINPYFSIGKIRYLLMTDEAFPAEFTEACRAFREEFAPSLLTEAGQEVEEVFFDLMRARGYQVATAESCTGGLLASTIINVPGSSDILSSSYVTYSEEAKIRILGVDPALIRDHGVVSGATATAMSAGLARLTGADLAIATTGIAGPSGGTEENPVGTVWVSLRLHDREKAFCLHLPGTRAMVRMRAVKETLWRAVCLLRED